MTPILDNHKPFVSLEYLIKYLGLVTTLCERFATTKNIVKQKKTIKASRHCIVRTLIIIQQNCSQKTAQQVRLKHFSVIRILFNI